MTDLNSKVISQNSLDYKLRRTFAIISHPDAGKTTLTEKLALSGGLIREAGEVKGKEGSRSTLSDWMELEKEKGISISSSVIQFDYRGLKMNLLDTPGHKDFSEDTYRTLLAADSAIMLIDVAKGVEERTKKLYEVCRYRKMPIFTIINKCDREGKNPLDLITEIEDTLQMKCFPVTWPLGLGGLFKGLYNRITKEILFYEGVAAKFHNKIVKVEDLKSDIWDEVLHRDIKETTLSEIELLDGVLEPFDVKAYLAGEVSPTSFTSAKMNFAIDTFLDFFTQWAPEPGPQVTLSKKMVSPSDDYFSGFVFKIQANMDPKHRDRMAFVRVCSGKFERGMKVIHSRLKRDIRLAYSSQFIAQSRETTDEAFAGDIIGVGDTGNFRVGDTISTKKNIEFKPMPRFVPELFANLKVPDAMKRKKLQKAIAELSEEGMIQLFFDPSIGKQDPIVGVVGELQFTVLLYRLKDEYSLDAKLDRLGFSVARWPQDKNKVAVTEVKGADRLYRDSFDVPVVLLSQEWDLRWLEKENADIVFATPFSFED